MKIILYAWLEKDKEKNKSKSSGKDDLKDAISRALSLSAKEKEKIIESGYKKVMSRTSQKVIGEKINLFLSKFFLD